ncbi:MAG: sulfatase-like hydrolase/transferase [Bacilli bacterium]|nr:sulfatase-like hydrolase/transferase [Bacilli bacterium]
MKNNTDRLFILNYLFILFLEIVYKCVIFEGLDINVLYLAVFTLPISILFTMITNLIHPIVNRILTYISWIGLVFVFGAEVVYYSFYKTIFSYTALSYGGQVAEYYDSIFEHIVKNWYVILAMACSLIIMIIITRKFSFKRVNFKHGFILLFSALALTASSVMYKSYETNSLYKLLRNKNDIMETTNSIGLITTVGVDFFKTKAGFEEQIELDISDEPVIEITDDNKEEYNVTDIDFETLINNESDPTVKTLHNYFSQQNPTNKNEMTGVFKDKNLIFITAEAFYPIAVDKELTPTLYKLVNEGIYFKNFYQPIYNCSTSDGEFVNLLSLLPGISTCSMVSTQGVYFPYTIGNSFKNYNYDVYAFHGWTYTYYKRQLTYPNLGFEQYYGYDRYHTGYKYALQGIKDSWPTSDIDVANASYPIYQNSDKFVAYYMSISGHLQYSWGGNAISRKNKSLVKDVKANDAIKSYIACNIDLDRSLKILMDNLEADGKLDDTVIVLSADHYPYGLTNEDIKSYTDFVKDESFDIYRNNLIIYNSELKGVEVDKNVGSIDILPTVLNMFDIKYDSRLLMGHDVFSDASDLVIYNNKSWISDKGRYDHIKKKFYPKDGVTIEDGYVQKMNNIVSTKFQVSKNVIQKDYYRKVLGG